MARYLFLRNAVSPVQITDDEGKTRSYNRTFRNIDTNISDEAIYQAVEAVMELQEHVYNGVQVVEYNQVSDE